MLDYREVKNVLHTRLVEFTLKEYLFVVQVVMGENTALAYASVFDEDFSKNVPSETEEDYLARFAHKAELLLEQQSCKHLKEYLEQEYQSEVQSKASTLKDYRFTGADVQQLLANLLHNRAGGENLDDASVRDVISLVKSLYDSGALDSGDSFERHFITIPNKYNSVCPNCGREGYAIHGLDFRCEFCGNVAKWSENEKRYYPELMHL